jgi:hypothetical protein
MNPLPPRVQKLVDLITNRLKDGYNRNLADHRVFAAIDLAYEAPFNQTTATMIQYFLRRGMPQNGDELEKELEKFGLKQDDLFLSVQRLVDGKDTNVLIPNPPVFFNFLLPLVLSVCTQRTATFFNERNTSPLLPFNPLIKTAQNRVVCEVVTNLIQTIAGWYNYQSYLDQSIKQMVKYGVALAFPEEEWDCEYQLQEGDDGKEEKQVVKEGIRYLFPHPSRMFYDLYHPLPTLNSDTGIEFAAHWQIVPYSEILDNRMYWNRECISYGTNWFDNPLAGNYFQEFYPCKLKFPSFDSGPLKREDKAAFYSSSDRDKAVFQTQFYMKLVPKDFGLGRYEQKGEGKKAKKKLVDTYDYPVWHRFVVAGDGTIIWAEPCAYVPNWFMGYNYDAQSGRQVSLGLETIPWQDHTGNIMTQMKLTCQQNLDNVTWYDTNMVNKTDVENLANLGERRYKSRNFLPFDSLKMSRSGGMDVSKAFITSELQYRSIQDLVTMMGQTLDIMDRVLGFTAQDGGATAKHYQSAEEIKETAGSSDARANYTGASIDNGIDAWKIQIYTAAMAYMDVEFESQVSSDIPDVEKILADLGFTIIGRTKDKILISGQKSKLKLEGFMKIGGGDEPEPDNQTAQVMFQTIGIISSHPEFFQAIGVKKVISLLEQAAKIAGADKDFKLPVENQPPPPGQPAPGAPPQPGQPPPGAPPPGQPMPPTLSPEVMQELIPILKQVQQQTLQIVEEKIAKPAAAEMVKQENQIKQLDALMLKVEELLKGLHQQPAAPVAPQLPPR